MEKMLDEYFVLTDYDGTLSNKSQFLVAMPYQRYVDK